jgi:hypothetical protein
MSRNVNYVYCPPEFLKIWLQNCKPRSLGSPDAYKTTFLKTD